MTTEDTPDWPQVPQHYGQHPIPSQNPPGETTPPRVSREPTAPTSDWDDLVRETRRLFRNARHPRAEPEWGPLRDQWEDWESMLADWIECYDSTDVTDDGEFAVRDRLKMCRWFLGRTAK